jgi:hypothetical protein
MNIKAISALKEIKTPLAFLSLVVLVAEGILLYLMKKATGFDLTILIIGCILLPFACLVVLYLLYKDPYGSASALAVKDEIQPPSGKTYELFVSAPMAAFESDKDFQASRNAIFDVVRAIKKNCRFNDVFYAGTEIESHKDFESEDLSVVEDYDACFRSKYFILIYPQKLATSALIELGWAMAHRKPIIIFTKKRGDLPFLAKNADAVFANLRIYEYKTSSDIIDRFYANGAELFTQLEKATSRWF